MSTNPPLSIEVDTLPVTNPVTTRIPKHRKKLTLIPLIFIIYFEVAGGPYGEEPVVKAAGPLFAIIGFSIFPLIWLFWGSLMGSWKLLTSVINLSAFPILCVAYLEKLFPIFEDGLPRLLAIFILNLVLAFICFTGIDIAGYALIVLVVVSLAPFVAAETIGGTWLKILINIGVPLSAMGLYFALLRSCSFQILGQAASGYLPKFFEARAKKFGTPWVRILVSYVISIGFSFMQFTNIISSSNFIYSLSMLLEYATIIRLRVKYPNMKRPYKIPLGVKLLVVMCMVPSAFLVLVMVIAKKIVLLISGLMTIGAIMWYFLMKFCKQKKWFAYRNGDEIEVGEEEDIQILDTTS
ncbi:hypothetical protein CTI12_AA155650 [Artemisia annua]|uniref:Amino acid/polyamine transporter I n=1 Tax=Artemisia annua TaxID=35608 RepID=A0A2U1PGI0_ARTAN|nr:hypothetical protein CTI12_AA155650 [Artemisia annua]